MAARYAPARTLGNLRAGPRTTPVEEMVATGPGTLSPGSGQGANGKGAYGKQAWTVVISRKLPAGLAAGGRTHVAFAVWQGAQKEAGARKMRTGWIPLLRKGRQ
jgi:DMSO reductase family type II enzyme heme b subunit